MMTIPPTTTVTFETLPVELVADILCKLDLETLIQISQLSRRLRDIASDSSLNPWRQPILTNLRSASYEGALKNLSVRSTVPRHNWIEILSLATPSFILFESTLPNLSEAEWEECFRRRFLPGWARWKRGGSWHEVFLKMLYRVWHRSSTTCTSDEAWSKYVVLNKSGSANELEISVRNFSPLAIFNEMKLQSNLDHLETRVRLVVELADVRVLALGTLHRPRSTLIVNTNARLFLHPPGIETGPKTAKAIVSTAVSDHGVYPISDRTSGYPAISSVSPETYTRMTHPLPALSHANYPLYTPGGSDKRWIGSDQMEEDGLQWVGGLMIIAQILGPKTHEPSGEWAALQDLDLVVGPSRQQYTSLTLGDLWAIAPWMHERITKVIDGPGL